jgi:hypothetical protein
MSTTAPTSSWSEGLLPAAVAERVIESARKQSVVLQLATTQPMPAHTEAIPVVSVAPQAGWVGVGGRKPIAKIAWTSEVLKAEEVAAVTALPDALLTDTTGSWDSEASTEAELGKAVARALDAAVLWGDAAPASFPAGGLAAFAGGPVSGADALTAISDAMGELEGEGIIPDGIAGGPTIGAALRAAYLAAGALPGEAPAGTVFGLPAAVTAPWPSSGPNAFVGGWEYVAIGIREDVSFGLSKDGVLLDENDAVVISAFQDNMTLVKVFARFGCAFARPLGADGETPATPIVGASWTSASGSAEPASATAASAQQRRKA